MSYSTHDIGFDGLEESGEELICADCGCNFTAADFEFVDAEFDEVECRCPQCQLIHDVDGYPCDFCDEPAAHSLGSTFYCEEHFQDLSGD